MRSPLLWSIVLIVGGLFGAIIVAPWLFVPQRALMEERATVEPPIGPNDLAPLPGPIPSPPVATARAEPSAAAPSPPQQATRPDNAAQPNAPSPPAGAPPSLSDSTDPSSRQLIGSHSEWLALPAEEKTRGISLARRDIDDTAVVDRSEPLNHEERLSDGNQGGVRAPIEMPAPPPQSAPPPPDRGRVVADHSSTAPLPSELHADQPKLSVMDSATVDHALESLRQGKVAFNTPETAKVDQPFVVGAHLAMQLSNEAMQALVSDPGKVNVADLRVAGRMSACLEGAPAFDITPAGPQEQLISSTLPAEWSWTVTPRKGGQQTLVLSFDALVAVDGKDGRVRINTLKRNISVNVGFFDGLADTMDVVRKIGDNAKAILVTLLIPAFLAIGQWWRKRHKRRTPPPSTKAPHAHA